MKKYSKPFFKMESSGTKIIKMPKTVTRRKAVLCAVIAAVTAIIFTLAVLWFYLSNSAFGQTLTKLYALNRLVQQNYTGSVSTEKLDEALLNAYVDTMDDKYGFYEGAKSAEAVADSFKGESYGVGITVLYEKANHCLFVYRVYEGGPAEQAGLKVGDRITAVDGQTVKELGYKKAVAAIKKQKNTAVTLTVLRGSQTVELKPVCGEFTEQAVFYRLIGQKAYIQITGFNDATVTQFEKALAFANTQKATGLVFDVRDNGGGTVDSAAKMLDLLLGECNIISVEYKNQPKKVLYRSNKEKTNLPMVVIANGETASAAELFTAALRDAGNAKIVGNTTYGKGVMQRTYFFNDGSCVRMTVAKFYPPGGVCFDQKGIDPDVTVTYTAEQQNNYHLLGDADPYIQAALKAF